VTDSPPAHHLLSDNKFFGFEPVDVLGYKVMISDREKSAIDCIDHMALAGGVGEAATILATASRRFDWNKADRYLERIGSVARVRRLGWLVDHVKADIPPEMRNRLLRLAGRRRKTWLGPDPARARCRVPSTTTIPGVCSSTLDRASRTAAAALVGARPSERAARNADTSAGAALRH
jgi:hypothetical protein